MALAPVARAETRIAVVVGMSDYPAVPVELQVQGAREDARALGRLLEDAGGYDAVHVMLDGLATREGLERLMIDVVGPSLQPGDTLLWAFVGHGYGADFGDPYLALHDFDAADPENTGLTLERFGPHLANSLVGVNLVILTDAAHAGALDGLALLGPSASNWPPLRDGVFILSATSEGEASPDGVFFHSLVRGLSGQADIDGDGAVSTSELYRWAVLDMADKTGDTVHPAVAGSYDPDLAVASTRAVSPAPQAQAPLPTPAPSHERRWGGTWSYSLMGAGALVAGGGLYAYGRGLAYCQKPDGELVCFDQPGYQAWRYASFAGYGAGALLGVTGFGLAFVPTASQGGAGVLWSGHF